MAMNDTVKQISKLTQKKERMVANCAKLTTELAKIDVEIEKLADKLTSRVAVGV